MTASEEAKRRHRAEAFVTQPCIGCGRSTTWRDLDEPHLPWCRDCVGPREARLNPLPCEVQRVLDAARRAKDWATFAATDENARNAYNELRDAVAGLKDRWIGAYR